MWIGYGESGWSGKLASCQDYGAASCEPGYCDCSKCSGCSLLSFCFCLERKKYNFPAKCKLLLYWATWVYCILYLLLWLGGRIVKVTQLILHILKIEHIVRIFSYRNHYNDNWDGTSDSDVSVDVDSDRGYYIKITGLVEFHYHENSRCSTTPTHKKHTQPRPQ